MHGHRIADLPLVLVKLHMLALLDPAEHRVATSLARRAQLLESQRLVGVRDDLAHGGVVAVGGDGGVAAEDQGLRGEGAVTAGRVDEEAVAAHGGIRW